MSAFHLWPRGKGLIINISSMTGVHPQPLLTLYSASKVLFQYDVLALIVSDIRWPRHTVMFSHWHTVWWCSLVGLSVFFFIPDFRNILLSVSPCRVQVKGNYCPGKVCNSGQISKFHFFFFSVKSQITLAPLISPQCVAPFLVSTNMTKNVKVNSFMKSATAFAREALNTVGHSSCTTGCLSHAVQVSYKVLNCYSLEMIPSNTLTCHFSNNLQNALLTMLLPDCLRMSTFLIRKLRSSCKKNDLTGENRE